MRPSRGRRDNNDNHRTPAQGRRRRGRQRTPPACRAPGPRGRRADGRGEGKERVGKRRGGGAGGAGRGREEKGASFERRPTREPGTGRARRRRTLGSPRPPRRPGLARPRRPGSHTPAPCATPARRPFAPRLPLTRTGARPPRGAPPARSSLRRREGPRADPAPPSRRDRR